MRNYVSVKGYSSLSFTAFYHNLQVKENGGKNPRSRHCWRTDFCRVKSILTAQKGSLFEKMVNGAKEPGNNGFYFIDRDPIIFTHVLKYLRGELPSLDMLSTTNYSNKMPSSINFQNSLST